MAPHDIDNIFNLIRFHGFMDGAQAPYSRKGGQRQSRQSYSSHGTVDEEALFGDVEPGGPVHMETGPDFWSFNGILLTRHHLQPRKELYQPDDSAPIPLKYIDVHRFTKVFNKGEEVDMGQSRITDWWDGSSLDRRELDKEWTGTTSFQLVQPACKQAGHMFLPGREKPVRVISSKT